jgi:hypothetical protein
MKNLFFGLVTILMCSSAFANSGTSLEKVSEKSLINLYEQNSNYYKGNYSSFTLYNKQILEDCTIVTDIKITKDGKTTTIKGTNTIKGVSCAEFFKGLLS